MGTPLQAADARQRLTSPSELRAILSVMDSGKGKVEQAQVGRAYTLQGPDGPYQSATPGSLGGHKPQRLYGRLDCKSALRAIANGGPYVKHRVFFADEPTAKSCGYRPCSRCMPEAYAVWKAAQR